MNTEIDLTNRHGAQVGDDGELSCLRDIIAELTDFINQFSTHAMSDHTLYLKGQKAAYEDCIAYLRRIAPTINNQ